MRTYLHNRKPTKIVAVFLTAVLTLCGSVDSVSAQSGATVYGGGTAATPQYGSLSGGAGSLGSLIPVISYQSMSSTSPSSALVAQTPQPATVTVPGTVQQPVVSTPALAQPTLTQPNLSASTLLQPLDPYATPSQSSLFQLGSAGSPLFGSATQTTYGQNNTTAGVYSGQFDRFVPETYDAVRRFREATSFEYTFLPGGSKSNSFGLNEIDVRMQLTFPCRFIPNNGGQGFFFVAPGGGVVWWDGPVGPPTGTHHMSPNGFKAFIDVGMQPQFNDVFGLNAWFRFGVFSDFKEVNSDALRYQGRIEGIFNVSKEIQIFAGVIYMDRARVKMMPTGGVVWTPRDDLVLKLVFPNPKISKRLWTRGNAEWWGYLQADYGGDSWNIRGLGKTDYNDIRVGVGLEFETISRIGGFFEFGGAFGRELYSQHRKWGSPPDVLYLKTGFIF